MGSIKTFTRRKERAEKEKGGREKEIDITTLGSRSVDDECGNPPVMDTRLPPCGFAFYSLVATSWRASHASSPSRAYITLDLVRRRLLWGVVAEGLWGGRESLPPINSV